jgi:hypothetical protein
MVPQMLLHSFENRVTNQTNSCAQASLCCSLKDANYLDLCLIYIEIHCRENLKAYNFVNNWPNYMELSLEILPSAIYILILLLEKYQHFIHAYF